MVKNKSPNPDWLQLDNQLCFALYVASRLVTRLYQPLLEAQGLTYPQYVVLLILWQEGPSSISRIGELAALNSNTLTPLVKRLESLGHVTRLRSKEDERKVMVHLTARGTSLREECECIPQALYSSIQYPQKNLVAIKTALGPFIQYLRRQE